ncbi:hypothetical protein [Aestuariivirga sp.]|uniref:hypothetical protein n=1 Tax=Aestuariivirga sp. TaxID=2650926 RepID=UPI003BA921E1
MALLLVVLLSLAGGAMDVGIASMRQDTLQQNIDAAAKAALTEGTDVDAKKMAETFTSLYPTQPGMTAPVFNVTTSINNGARQVNITATSKVSTRFLNVIDIPSITIRASTTTESTPVPMEIALAMDVTPSMQGSMTALRTAATDLVDKLYTAAARIPGTSVRFAVVPFSDQINLGTRYKGKPWISYPADQLTCKCTSIAPDTCTRDGESYTCYKCVAQETVCTANLTWLGCTGVRKPAYRTKISNADTNRYPGFISYEDQTIQTVFTQCGPEISPLNDNKSQITTSINGLNSRTSGDTYLPTGFIWGWNMLTHEEPVTDAVSQADAVRLGVRKFLIFLSDGGNATVPDDNNGGFPAVSNPTDPAFLLKLAQANTDTRTLCTNMHTTNPEIEVYTILYRSTDPATVKLLEDCASSPANALLAANTNQLADAFVTIANSIQVPRLTK